MRSELVQSQDPSVRQADSQTAMVDGNIWKWIDQQDSRSLVGKDFFIKFSINWWFLEKGSDKIVKGRGKLPVLKKRLIVLEMM